MDLELFLYNVGMKDKNIGRNFSANIFIITCDFSTKKFLTKNYYTIKMKYRPPNEEKYQNGFFNKSN
jgi:hypothetical protein